MSVLHKSFYLLLFILIFFSCKKERLTKDNWHVHQVLVDGQDYTDIYRSTVIDESINFQKKNKKYLERFIYVSGE